MKMSHNSSAFAIYSRKSHQKSAGSPFFSEIENAILRSCEPITINETQEICAAGNRGIWANRCEVCTWKGDIPICEYPINEDACPEVLNKRSKQRLEYIQEMAVRYLKPPAPPTPGEIIIKQEPNQLPAPAPPIVIRQQPPRPCTPEPLVIREAPPQPPPCVGRKVITISGKRLPPAPRKVVIERMAPMPSKPQSVMIERWLPYAEVKRRVIYQKPPPDPVVCKPRNVIVQWEAPEVCVKKEIKHLGVVCANPCDYVKRYGPTLKRSCELPQFVLDIKPQCGIELAANKKTNPVHELCGDVCALNMVNLDCEGLGVYKKQVREKCGSGGCGSRAKSSKSTYSSAYSSCPAQSSSAVNCSASCSSDSARSSIYSPSYSASGYGSASVSGYGSASASASALASASGSTSASFATPSYDSCSPPCPAPCPPSAYDKYETKSNSSNNSSNNSSRRSSRRSSPKYSSVNLTRSPTYY